MTAREMASAVMAGTRAALRSTIVRVLEPQKGAWVNQNLWGDQRVQPLPGDPGQIVSVLGKNTIMYGPPAVHSVQLARGDETPAVNSDVRARVTYGCGGMTNTFDCDWLHGQQFTLVCNSVSVAAVSYAPRSKAPYDPGTGAVFLGVAVCKGSSHAASALTYTEPRDTMQDAEIDDYPVRDFVREICVHLDNNDDPSVATNVHVQLLDAGGSGITYDAQVFAGGRRVPLPGMTSLVRIRNNSGGVALVCVEWFLAL